MEENQSIEHIQPSTIHGDSWMNPRGKKRLVSVVLPTYNRAHFLSDALRSIYQQTHRPIELIVVDDGSTDDTAELVESFIEDTHGDEEFEVRYFYQSNHGAPTARNRGLVDSRGEFIQFMDSDDILHPQKLEIQTQILEKHPELDHTWSDFQLANEEEFEPYTSAHRVQYDSDEVAHDLNVRSRTPSEVWSGLYRRRACRQIGPWNETLERWQDVEYNFRFDCLSPNTARSGVELYKMRFHDTGRILDARYQGDGIDKGLHTLRVLEHEAAELNPSDIPDGFGLGGWYFKLMQTGLRVGGHSRMEEVFAGVIDHSKSKYRRLATRLLRGLYQVLGPEITHSVFQVYRKIREN
jgi:glycosyltransferase involved in cell wall biosynthesis